MCFQLNKKNRRAAFTLAELMIALSVGTIASLAAIILYLFILRGMFETTSKLMAQQKADMIVQKITRGPMGTFGGIHSVYYNAAGSPGAPNPVITTVSTNPTNQTFAFYVQTNFSGFNYISMTRYLNTSMSARYTVGYNSASNYIYYTVGGGNQIPMVQKFESTFSIGRFMFSQSNATVNLTFDLLIQKTSGVVLTNTYETAAFYRNNPQE